MTSAPLVLIRHGQTTWNVEGRYTGQSDIPLNEVGRAQARQLAQRLRYSPPDVIITSDLQRAYETAAIVAEVCGVPLQVDARLREINQGVWEGLHFADIKRRFAAEFAARKAEPLTVAAPGGETVAQVRERTLAAVRDAVTRFRGQTVALVAHGLVLALIKAEVMSAPAASVFDLIPPNAEAEMIEWGPLLEGQR